jgi:hypothetical protein
MKTFAQYITEKRDKLMAMSPHSYSYGDEDAILIDGLINPSYDELRGYIERTNRKSTRFILHKDRLLVWDAQKAIHADVVHGEFRLGKDGLYTVVKTRGSVVGYFEKMRDGIIAGVAFSSMSPNAKKILNTHKTTRHIIADHSVPVESADDSGMLVRY